MPGGMTIDVDAEGVVRMLEAGAVELRHGLLALLTESSELVKESERAHAPVGVGGDSGLKGSIGYTLIPETLASEIKPEADYAAAVETGSKPHWAPIEPLKAWAELRGLNPYALRWSIAQKGTQPHPYVRPTYEEMAPIVGGTFAAGIASLIGSLSGASL